MGRPKDTFVVVGCTNNTTALSEDVALVLADGDAGCVVRGQESYVLDPALAAVRDSHRARRWHVIARAKLGDLPSVTDYDTFVAALEEARRLSETHSVVRLVRGRIVYDGRVE